MFRSMQPAVHDRPTNYSAAGHGFASAAAARHAMLGSFFLPRTDGRHGFSMIDAVVTILILGIISAVTVPRMAESLERYRLRSAATVLAEQIVYVRRQAIVNGRDLNVQLSSRPASMRCDQLPMPNRVGENYAVDLADAYQIQRMSWSGLDGTNLRFDRHGNAYDDGVRLDTWSIQLEISSAIATLTLSANDTEIEVQ